MKYWCQCVLDRSFKNIKNHYSKWEKHQPFDLDYKICNLDYCSATARSDGITLHAFQNCIKIRQNGYSVKACQNCSDLKHEQRHSGFTKSKLDRYRLWCIMKQKNTNIISLYKSIHVYNIMTSCYVKRSNVNNG